MGELTAMAVRNAQPRETMYRLAAGKGLYLQVMPTGARYWRLKYRFAGVSRMMGLGVYPEVSLAEAREARDAARKQLASGTDPSMQRRIERMQRELAIENSLESIGRTWFAGKESTWVEGYARGISSRLELNIYPWLGKVPIVDITSGMLLACLQRIVDRGAVETAHRTLNYLVEIYRWAIPRNMVDRNVAADLVGVLPASSGRNFPTLTDPDRIGELLRAIDVYHGSYITRYALQIAPLVFTRPTELRAALWTEFDLDAAVWAVPGANLKMRKALKATAEPHLVPLSRQAVALLRELHPLTGHGKYVFPGERAIQRPMSDGTINAAFARMGFKGEIVHHGLRHMASTALNELGWDEDEIERQLSHKQKKNAVEKQLGRADKNRIRGIYNKAKYLETRKKMMQAWADYLDGLRAPRPAVPMSTAKRSARAGGRRG
ncbi:MAG TPA: integrase arm-type DNA-binding domain-containing protein [Rhodanobacter sp.]|jgi:integrase|nr:integrase arm-type DNA-binding domain-containing protein [Rhodanobacter sp.]